MYSRGTPRQPRRKSYSSRILDRLPAHRDSAPIFDLGRPSLVNEKKIHHLPGSVLISTADPLVDGRISHVYGGLPFAVVDDRNQPAAVWNRRGSSKERTICPIDDSMRKLLPFSLNGENRKMSSHRALLSFSRVGDGNRDSEDKG